MELKHFIFGICEIKGLKFIGVSLYYICIGIISAIFRFNPEIRSLYIYGSMATGDIIPGLSDIDIVVVIRDISIEQEYRLLRHLERQLKYLMPPLGKDKIGTHVLIYSAREWSLIGDLSAGKKFGPPLKIFEKDNVIFTRQYDKQINGLQHFYRAAWRLETIQDDMSSSVNSTYDLRARQRSMERCLQSILYGLNELNRDTAASPRLNELTNQIVSLQNKSRELTEVSSLNSLIPHIIHILDIVISYGFRSLPIDIGLGNASKSKETERNTHTAKQEASKLFINIFGDIPRDTGKLHELMICTKARDYFVYDLENFEISENLIRYYAVDKERRLRIMSPNYLKLLYLNFPAVSYTFIKFPDKKVLIKNGRLDHARLVIDTYSLFPQLRATDKRKISERYKSLSNWTLDLIGAWDVERNVTASDFSEIKDCNAEFTETDADGENEFERFRKLKLMSSVLTDILYEGVEVQSESNPSQRTS